MTRSPQQRKPRAHRSLAAALSVGVAALGLTVVTPGTALAKDDCPHASSAVAPGKLKSSYLWAQKALDVPRVWSTTQGEGVKVAVIDSGVDASLDKAFGDRVSPGHAYIKVSANGKGNTDATDDCDGHGTEVAAIIAGKKYKGIDFYGMAPKATIVPYRIANARPAAEDKDDKKGDGSSTEKTFASNADVAKAIRAAADGGAKVLNLSLKYSEDVPGIRDAIAHAIDDKGAVVVAAAGNEGAKQKKVGDRISYPAAYPGVIGVGAVNSGNGKTVASESGDWVDVVAPGENTAAPLPSSADGKFEPGFGGTSGATAFVSGTAALLAAQHKDWSGKRISRQILGTASPTPGGTGMNKERLSPGYGHGMIDPYRAVTERLHPEESPEDNSEMDVPPMGDKEVAEADHYNAMKPWAIWIAAGALALFAAALTGVGAMRRARKHDWRIRKVSKDDQTQPFDDGDPISLYQGIKGLKE
ncbi:MAG TPA: S8 family serine peptidase [Stackebrandtia sp.]|jgi:type VII secretion-associated serine protease mycosin|uniref:S8 family serine peptidase n=1 Tax=Stackebrandtia sp. TaxID=2023065 RepID=UPI002D331C70|nr:S8 family serine peptidase [Stackebrandtia sp.]HZE38069.1 S8 family serine peptidase [Stackebrandtia sp.]